MPAEEIDFRDVHSLFAADQARNRVLRDVQERGGAISVQQFHEILYCAAATRGVCSPILHYLQIGYVPEPTPRKTLE